MKKDKNIDRLFQEKFKDFEVTPPDFVWENIQEKLNSKEKKRRVIPFWFKTAGIAASFVAILAVVFNNTNNNFKNSNSNNSVVTSDVEKDNQTGTRTNTSKIKESNRIESNTTNTKVYLENKSNSIVTTNSIEKKPSTSGKIDSRLNKRSTQNITSNAAKNGIVVNQKNKSNQKRWNNNKSSFSTSNSQMVAYRKKEKNNKKSTSTGNDFFSINNNSLNTEITDLSTFNSTKNKALNSEVPKFNSIPNHTLDAAITNNSLNSSNTTLKNSEEINGSMVEKDTQNTTTNSTTIVATEEIKTDTITLATTTNEENPMEKLLREKETKKVVTEKDNKWAVNSFISPVFFNSFTTGSPLSEEFDSNEKTFNNSTSYGVGVAYNLNKRLTIKTGVNNLNLDYDTENIAFYSSFEDQSKIANTNIERNANGKYIVLKNDKDISKNEIENQVILSNENLGNLNQRTQYVEVPLEISYAILNKKMSVAIKGGMSTLFLTDNIISISGNDGNMQIGKASNLNNVHFSSNLGLGFGYTFMKNFQLNVEPTLKYQINTFNKNSENFSPYVIGVLTGISYKF